jgi:hypothetical protein
MLPDTTNAAAQIPNPFFMNLVTFENLVAARSPQVPASVKIR